MSPTGSEQRSIEPSILFSTVANQMILGNILAAREGSILFCLWFPNIQCSELQYIWMDRFHLAIVSDCWFTYIPVLIRLPIKSNFVACWCRMALIRLVCFTLYLFEACNQGIKDGRNPRQETSGGILIWSTSRGASREVKGPNEGNFSYSPFWGSTGP